MASLALSTQPEVYALSELRPRSPYSINEPPAASNSISYQSANTPISIAPETWTPAGEVMQSDSPPPFPPLRPVKPATIMDARYDNRVTIRNAPGSRITSFDMSRRGYHRTSGEGGWEPYRHPEGKLYYIHKRWYGFCDRLAIYTHADFFDSRIVEEVISVLQRLEPSARFLSSEQPDDKQFDLVIDLIDASSQDRTYGYYFACFQEKSIFWPLGGRGEIKLLTGDQRFIYEEFHLEDIILTEFWNHVETFPHNKYLTLEHIDLYVGTLNYAIGDILQSEYSITPFELPKMQELIRSARYMKEGGNCQGDLVIIARVMSAFSLERFFNYHGQRIGTRLNRDESSYADSIARERPIFFTLISPILFFMPDVYLSELEKIWVDRTVNYRPWNIFITELKRDWKASMLPTTVLLSANVGFLAIQSIDNVKGTPNRTVAQIASYASTLLCLANFLVTQILARQHRKTASREDCTKAADYLLSKETHLLGLEGVAFAFSLPYALFIWSALTLTAAVCWVCFFSTDVFVQVLLGTVFAILSLLIILILCLDWGLAPTPSFHERIKAAMAIAWSRMPCRGCFSKKDGAAARPSFFRRRRGSSGSSDDTLGRAEEGEGGTQHT